MSDKILADLNEIEEITYVKKVDFNKRYQQIIEDENFLRMRVNKKFLILDILKQKIDNNPNLSIYVYKYKSDGLQIFGWLFFNSTITEKVPVMIVCKGGNNLTLPEGLSVEYFFNSTYFDLVKDGKLMVFASDYRGYRLSEGKDEFIGNDVNDVINLYPIVKKFKLADENKIGIYGKSRGVGMAFMTHLKVDWAKTLILIAGNYSHKIALKHRPEFIKDFLMSEKFFNLTEKDLIDRDLITHIDNIKKIPILIIHGTNDVHVNIEHSREMHKKLIELEFDNKLVEYDTDHFLSGLMKEVSNEIIEWLETKLI